MLTFGFGKSLRGSNQGHAETVSRVDFAPIERRIRGKIPEKRSVSETGDLTKNLGVLLSSPASSGFVVNEQTALNVAAVTACVGLLADMVAKLPLYLYQETPDGPKEITDHPGIALIGRYPSDAQTSFELRQLMETGKGLGGNGYARVYRDAFGDPRSIQWLAPCEVTPVIVKRSNGEKFITYQVEGEKEILTRGDIIHIRWLSRDGFTGMSPIRQLRESIGTALSQTSAAGKLMRNGARFPGIVTTDQVYKREVMEAAKDEWERNTMNGSLGKTPFLSGQFKFQETNGMSMVDAQFLESRRFELQEIARIYRVPTFIIGDATATTWGSGIEQMTLGFLNFCLDPHLVGWEQSLGHTLLTTKEQKSGYYFKFDRDELANVALDARANFYQTMRNIGVYSANDVRRQLNEPIISAEDGGDDYGRPFNASGGTPMTADPQPAPEPVPA